MRTVSKKRVQLSNRRCSASLNFLQPSPSSFPGNNAYVFQSRVNSLQAVPLDVSAYFLYEYCATADGTPVIFTIRQQKKITPPTFSASTCQRNRHTWVVMWLERGAYCFHVVRLMQLHLRTPSSLAAFKSRPFLPFLYQLTQVSWKRGH